MKSKSLVRTFRITITLTIVILIISLGLFFKFFLKHEFEKLKNESLLYETKSLGVSIENLFSDLLLGAQRLSQSDEILSYFEFNTSPWPLTPKHLNLPDQRLVISNIWLYKVGDLSPIEHELLREHDFNLREWYQELVIDKKSYSISSPYADYFTGKQVVTIATPTIKNNQIIGILGVDIIVEQLVELLDSQHLGDSGYLSMISNQGLIISHINEDLRLQHINDAGIDITFKQTIKNDREQVIRYTQHNQSFYGAIYSVEPGNFKIVGSMSKGDFLKPLYPMFFILDIMITSTLIGGILIIYMITSWYTKPLKQIKYYCEQLNQGNTDFDISHNLAKRTDEIGILINNIINSQLAKSEQLLIAEQLKAQLIHYKFYEEYIETLKTFKHDFKNHVIIINTLVQENRLSELQGYMKKLGAEFNHCNIPSYCENYVLDALLKYHIMNPENQDIIFNINACLPQNISIDNTDLCIIIGNLLNNALEAVHMNKINKTIDLNIYIKNTFLCINIKNTYEQQNIKENNQYRTTKASTFSHGIGLQSIEHIVELNKGDMKIIDVNQMFEVKIVLKCVTNPF